MANKKKLSREQYHKLYEKWEQQEKTMTTKKEKKVPDFSFKLKPDETLCWRCVHNRDRQCPWISKCQHVEGWTAYPLNEYQIQDPNYPLEMREITVQGMCVRECPLFDNLHIFGMDYTEVLIHVARTLGYKDRSNCYRHPLVAFLRYEEETGLQLPEWAWFEAREAVKLARKREKEKEKTSAFQPLNSQNKEQKE